jgi:uncharacterized membrane protein YfcA
MSATTLPSERERAPSTPPTVTSRSAMVRPPAWRMARTNLALGATVFVVWLVLGNARALQAVADHWQVSLTMIFGSLVGGGTSEGGGAVAFPVMTKVLAVPAPQARLFTFAIQSVGMGAATLTIVFNHVPVEWKAIRNGAPWAMLGVVISSLFLAPRLDAPGVRLLFTAILVSLALALLISRRCSPDRRDELERVGRRERAALFGAGLFGGMLSGAAGLGENTVMFALLVLGFRVCERVVTPTTVILLTTVSWAGFATHLFLMGDFTSPVVDMWLAAVPIVAIGAPTGALICTRMSRDAIVRLLYVLISIEFVSTLLLVPMTVDRAILFAFAIAAFTLLCARMATGGRCEARAQNAGGAGAPG